MCFIAQNARCATTGYTKDHWRGLDGDMHHESQSDFADQTRGTIIDPIDPRSATGRMKIALSVDSLY